MTKLEREDARSGRGGGRRSVKLKGTGPGNKGGGVPMQSRELSVSSGWIRFLFQRV